MHTSFELKRPKANVLQKTIQDHPTVEVLMFDKKTHTLSHVVWYIRYNAAIKSHTIWGWNEDKGKKKTYRLVDRMGHMNKCIQEGKGIRLKSTTPCNGAVLEVSVEIIFEIVFYWSFGPLKIPCRKKHFKDFEETSVRCNLYPTGSK